VEPGGHGDEHEAAPGAWGEGPPGAHPGWPPPPAPEPYPGYPAEPPGPSYPPTQPGPSYPPTQPGPAHPGYPPEVPGAPYPPYPAGPGEPGWAPPGYPGQGSGPVNYGYGWGWSQPKQDTLAIVALVIGCISVPCCQALGVVALVLGFVSRSRIRQSGGALTGENLALAGIITGGIGLALFAVTLLLQVVMAVQPFGR
jgi:hypothetical protein